jgi:sugar lactone lactonase YvrE
MGNALRIPALVILSAAALAGCAGTPGQFWMPPEKELIWPLPPDPPRVRYEGTITAETIRDSASRGGFSAVLRLIAGAPEVKLQTPHGVSADGKTLAVADSGSAVVHLLDRTNGGYRAVESAGETRLQCPIGVAADGEGGVFVGDAVLGRVFHLSRRGRLIDEVAGDFQRPTGLAYDAARRRLYVVDTPAHSVLTFQAGAGGYSLLRRLGGRGEEQGAFSFPTHVCLAANGDLYVTDSLNFRVQVFTPDGASLRSFGRPGDGTGDFGTAKGVAADSEGHIYVVDSLFDVVQIFDENGRFLLSFAGSGNKDGELWLPTGACVDGQDRIYVADSGNSRVQVYQYVRQQKP